MTAPKSHSPDLGPDKTGGKQVTQFKPGTSGNVKGRPKGARSRLGERFLESLAADFEEHGEAVIEKVRTRDPTAYIKVISNILPREVLTAAFNVTATGITDVEDARAFLQAYRMVRDAPVVDLKPIDDEGAVVTRGWRADD